VAQLFPSWLAWSRNQARPINYQTLAIITWGLYIVYPIFEDQAISLILRSFFSENSGNMYD
jgi:hypothetical protein